MFDELRTMETYSLILLRSPQNTMAHKTAMDNVQARN